ncbi:MAG: glycosyltransferase family 4 protein [Verrucomicrobiae bacterium]|nr:glycosyltransferase family 4 protein [Verrucomicrobiae bacterium]
MKIVWVAPYDLRQLQPELRLARPVTRGHACSWIVNLADALARRSDVELHIITFSPLVLRDQTVRKGNATFHVLKSGVPILNRSYPSILPLDLLTGFQWEVSRIRWACATIKPEIVHAHGTEGCYALGGLATGLPCLISIQGIVGELFKVEPSIRFWLVRRLEARAIKRGRFFGCRTDFDTGYVKMLNPKGEIFFLPEAVNPCFFKVNWTPPERPQWLFVGSLVRRKGIETLLEAVALLRPQASAARVVVVGDGSPAYLSALRAQCKSLGIERIVDFVGFLPADGIAQLHAQSQLLILPSEIENSPNAVAEALVSGLPVIASSVGGIPSMIVNGKTGILVPPKNPHALAQAMVTLLASKDLQISISKQAVTLARRRHFPTNVAAATLDVYAEILRRKDYHE